MSKRICIVVDNLDPKAGWGRLASEIGHGLAHRGWSVKYVVSQGAERADVTVIPMRGGVVKQIAAVARLRRSLSAADVALCFDVNPYGVLVSLASIGLKTKIVIDALGTYSLFTRSRLRNALLRWSYRSAALVLIVSDFVRRSIERAGFRFETYQLAPVGVDIDRFSPGTERGNYVLSVGALKHRKGYHFTVPAFAEVAAEYPGLRYIIVGACGTGPYTESIQRIMDASGIAGRVEFKTGVSDDELVELYRGARAYIQTSVTDEDSVEGFGMSYLEAGACGTPAIGARESGAEAAIVDGETGYLVAHDAHAVAAALRRLLSDPARADEMGRAARTNAERYSWDLVVDLYAVELERL